MDQFTAELLGGPVSALAEGPVWHAEAGELAWIDILGKALHRAPFSPGGRLGEVRTTPLPGHIGAAVPVAGPVGGWLLAMEQGFSHLADDGTLRTLAQPEAESGGANRMNDAKCDPRGRWWAGSMAYDESQKGRGTLYRVDLDGSVTPMLPGRSVSNGLGWTADERTMFFADTGEPTLSTFAFDPDAGTIGERRVIVADPDLQPDGLTMDDEDHAWAACWDGGEIRRYDTGGQLLASVRVPVSRTSSCCFVGDLLVITTGEVPGERDSGRLFVARPGVSGPAAVRFAGALPE